MNGSLSRDARVFLISVDDRKKVPVHVDFVEDGGPFGAPNRVTDADGEDSQAVLLPPPPMFFRRPMPVPTPLTVPAAAPVEEALPSE